MKTLKWISITTLGYFVLDYFFLDKITLTKLVENFSALYLEVFIGSLAAIWYTLKYFQKYLKAKKSDFNLHMRAEQKIVTDLTIKFLDGLGPEFKKAINAYIQEKFSLELEQTKEYSIEMENELASEEETNIKVNKVNNFYGRIVKSIVSFEWCQECKKNIKRQRAQKNKLCDSPEREDTIFGDSTQINEKKIQKEALSAVDGKVVKNRLRLNSNAKEKELQTSESEKESELSELCVCSNLCKRKYFSVFLKMKKEFKKNSALFT